MSFSVNLCITFNKIKSNFDERDVDLFLQRQKFFGSNFWQTQWHIVAWAAFAQPEHDRYVKELNNFSTLMYTTTHSMWKFKSSSCQILL